MNYEIKVIAYLSSLLHQVALSRAARTDAGVCAAVNVLSLKLILTPPNLPADMPLEDYLNTFLPSSIRIWSILRVQGGFDPRHGCDQRHYEYTLPTHSFLGPKPGTAMADWVISSRSGATSSAVKVDSAVAEEVKIEPKASTEEVKVALEEDGPVQEASAVTTKATLEESTPVEIPSVELASTSLPPTSANVSELSRLDSVAMASSAAFWAAQPKDSTFAMDCEARKGWRISPELLESARSFVKAYEGSHNYYNFTVGKDFRDRSCQRVMRELKVCITFFS